MDAHTDWLETSALVCATSFDASPPLADSVRTAMRAAWRSEPTLDSRTVGADVIILSAVPKLRTLCNLRLRKVHGAHKNVMSRREYIL
jgi:hypothetical protein